MLDQWLHKSYFMKHRWDYLDITGLTLDLWKEMAPITPKDGSRDPNGVWVCRLLNLPLVMYITYDEEYGYVRVYFSALNNRLGDMSKY